MIPNPLLIYITCAVLILLSFGCAQPSTTPSERIKPVKINSDLTLLHRMQGRWLDVKNDESVIEVNRENFWSIYQDEVMKIHRLEVFDLMPANCNGKPSKNGMGFFITWGKDGSSYCYQLLSLDHGKMNYEALGEVVND